MLAGPSARPSAGEIEAARAMGMSRWQIMPASCCPAPCAAPCRAYSNEVVMMLHSTSLASTVPALTDITAVASQIYSDYYLPFEAYLAAAAIYLCVTFCLIGFFKLAVKGISWRIWRRANTNRTNFTMQRIDHPLLSSSLGTRPLVTSFHFGQPASGPRLTSRPACTPRNCPACWWHTICTT
jgi:hypothetical protein